MLGYKPEKNMLLLLSEIDGLEFTVFDLSEMKVINAYRMIAPSHPYYHFYTFIATTNPEFSGISVHSTFWIFNWNTYKAKNLGEAIDPVIWSPLLNGFLYVKNYDYDKLILLKP